MGVKKIYLTGYTPEPCDIFGKLRKDFQKTALGAEKYIKWEKAKNIFGLQVTVTTNAKSKEEGLELFRLLGFPLKM